MASRRGPDLARPGAPAGAPVLLVLPVLSLLVAVGTALLVLAPSGRTTSFFDVSRETAWAGTAAGTGLLLVGAALSAVDRRAALGPVTVLVGLAWLAPVWSGWETGPVAVRTVAVLLSPFLVPALAHLVLLGLGATGRRARLAVVPGYAVVGALVLARAVVHDPYRDRLCWLDCGRAANPLLLLPHTGAARTLGTVLLLVPVAVALAAAALTLSRLRTGRTRPLVLAVAAPATAALLGRAASDVLLVLRPGVPPGPGPGTVTFLLTATALLALVAGQAWAARRSRSARARVAALARELGDAPGPGELEAHLARSLHDRSLSVEYWSPLLGRYLDPEGGEVGDGATHGTTTRVVRGDVPVARVRHDPAVVSRRALSQELGSASRLVLDNERLRAERLARRRELRLSRSRVAAAADEHRAGLERDLHDGAQQRLLAAAYEMRLALAETEAAGEPRARRPPRPPGRRRGARAGRPARLRARGLPRRPRRGRAGGGAGVAGRERPRAPRGRLARRPRTPQPGGRADRLPPGAPGGPGRAGRRRPGDGARPPGGTWARGGDRGTWRDGRHVARRPGRGGGRHARPVVRRDGPDGAPVRVVVAEDSALTRAGIVGLLRQAGIDVVEEVAEAPHLMAAVARTAPDAVVVDIRMPPTQTDEGLVAARRIAAEHPGTAVLVLSQHVEPSYALSLLEGYPEGVGYLLKERVFDGAALADALRRLVAGETVVDPTIVARLLGRRRARDPLEALSEREREVLALVAEGLSNRAVAARLSVAERTVESRTSPRPSSSCVWATTPPPTAASARSRLPALPALGGPARAPDAAGSRDARSSQTPDPRTRPCAAAPRGRRRTAERRAGRHGAATPRPPHSTQLRLKKLFVGPPAAGRNTR